jgi:ribosomal protein S24E
MSNKLLHRRQMVVDVYHGQALSSGASVSSVSKEDLKERLAKMYKDFLARIEPKYRLRRNKLAEPRDNKNRRS